MHIVQGYSDDLNELTTILAQLGGVVEEMVADAIKSLKKRDSKLAKSVIKRDKTANHLQEQVDANSMRIFALRHPMAADLRRVVGAIKIATDLERVGDLAEGIARRTLTINEDDAIALAKGIAQMGKLVKSQLRDSLDAFLNNDTEKAIQVWLADEDVDAMYNSLFRELLTYMMEDARTISTSASLLFVAKNLERIGDHATNIAESVYFTVEGTPLIDHELLKSSDEDTET